MTIREFQAKLRATHTSNRLFAALRRLRTVESPQALKSVDIATADWIIWNALTEPGYSAQAS
jgi:hypothetical protein